ncbi:MULTISPECIES: hypothetical protein [Paenibacillus]|jgi:hypothetical protein|uniref:Uncharacterized protein n=1 Tax=Paenibacillus baimaensis TaxID=2982185 RepID=A0ABT2U7T3_9BACL|nr:MULTISPECIES: hypothetical protein [unclassified Paenibacillus]MCU6790567.1 hypothetical protein [Paenibacillus sp. WQ 127069]
MPKEVHHSLVDKVANFIEKTVEDTVEDTINMANRAEKAMGRSNKNKKD